MQNQIQYLKQVQQPSVAQLRSTMVDPAINLFFLKMKGELEQTKDKLEQAQNELCARDLNSGDKLLRACELSQENVLCESKMILLSLCKRWGVHHMSSGRSSVPANLWAVGVRAGHGKECSMKNFQAF